MKPDNPPAETVGHQRTIALDPTAINAFTAATARLFRALTPPPLPPTPEEVINVVRHIRAAEQLFYYDGGDKCTVIYLGRVEYRVFQAYIEGQCRTVGHFTKTSEAIKGRAIEFEGKQVLEVVKENHIAVGRMP